MNMELAPFFYAIAGCSATIIAIIGGFIASKLISISSEREGTITKIDELNKELNVQIERKNECERELNEDMALDYIEENIQELFQGKGIEDIYKNSEKQKIEKNILNKYWERSLNIMKDILSCGNKENIECNSDGVIEEIAIKYSGNFDYEICKIIFSEIDNEIKKQNNPYSGILYEASKNALKGLPRNGVLWEQNMDEILRKTKNRIQELEMQIEIFQEKKNAIRKPKGMAGGLLVFLLFSITGIIYPLICAFLTEVNCISSVYYSVVAIILFIVGIGSTFIYLIALLKWKE